MPARLDPERDPDLALARQILPRAGWLRLVGYLKAKRKRDDARTLDRALALKENSIYRVKVKAEAQKVRRCKGGGCEAKLSIYNLGTRCKPCQLRVDARDLARRVREQGRPLG